jgi:hypothetical protein
MVCLRNTSVDTLHKGDTDDNNNITELHDRSIITDRTVHHNRPHIVILDKTIKESQLICVSIPNSHNLHSTITEKLHKVNSFERRVFKNAKTEKGLYINTSIIGNRYYFKQITCNFKTASSQPCCIYSNAERNNP